MSKGEDRLERWTKKVKRWDGCDGKGERVGRERRSALGKKGERGSEKGGKGQERE